MLSKGAEGAITDEPLMLFVPEMEGEAFKAGEQGDWLDHLTVMFWILNVSPT